MKGEGVKGNCIEDPMALFTVLSSAMCGAAPCLLTAKDKNFGAIYGNDDEMAGGPRSNCR